MLLDAYVPYQSVYDIIIKIVFRWQTYLKLVSISRKKDSGIIYLLFFFSSHVFDDNACELICALTRCTMAVVPLHHWSVTDLAQSVKKPLIHKGESLSEKSLKKYFSLFIIILLEENWSSQMLYCYISFRWLTQRAWNQPVLSQSVLMCKHYSIFIL